MTELKWAAGQQVFEPSSGWGGNPGRVLTIDRVTPSGRAVIGSYQYGPDGRKMGERYGSRIEPLTDQHLADIAHWKRQQEAARLADGIRWRSLSPDELDIALPALRLLCPAPEAG